MIMEFVGGSEMLSGEEVLPLHAGSSSGVEHKRSLENENEDATESMKVNEVAGAIGTVGNMSVNGAERKGATGNGNGNASTIGTGNASGNVRVRAYMNGAVATWRARAGSLAYSWAADVLYSMGRNKEK